jgi:hypothetical protein
MKVAPRGTNLVTCHCKDSQPQERMGIILGRAVAKERERNAKEVNERP